MVPEVSKIPFVTVDGVRLWVNFWLRIGHRSIILTFSHLAMTTARWQEVMVVRRCLTVLVPEYECEWVVYHHDGRSAVLPYPGYEVCFRIQSILSESDDQPIIQYPHPGGWLEAPFLMANWPHERSKSTCEPLVGVHFGILNSCLEVGWKVVPSYSGFGMEVEVVFLTTSKLVSWEVKTWMATSKTSFRGVKIGMAISKTPFLCQKLGWRFPKPSFEL